MTDEIASGARLLLAAVLAVSAGTKLRGGDGLRGALVAYGVPDVLTPILRWLLPVTEAALAVVLVAVWNASWPAWVALGLLGAFATTTAANLATGRRPPCPCFGVTTARPISGRTLVRDAVLLALAVLATG